MKKPDVSVWGKSQEMIIHAISMRKKIYKIMITFIKVAKFASKSLGF